jgi:hypothetical protein
LAALGACVLAAKPLETDAAATAHRLLFFGSEDEIDSGHYALNNKQQKLGVLFFPLSYDLMPDSTVGPYLYGDIGYGTALYNQGGQKQWIKMYALKTGAGLRYTPNENTDLRIGGAYQLARFVANDTIKAHGQEAVASLSYHPWVGEWNPYIAATLRYMGTTIETPSEPSNTTHSVIGKLRAGVITPVLAYPFDLPTKIELYGAALSLHGDIPKLINSSYLWSAGAKLYLQSPILTDYISDITLGAQIVRGDKLKGFSVGVGVKF